jgi:hypothetical protein
MGFGVFQKRILSFLPSSLLLVLSSPTAGWGGVWGFMRRDGIGGISRRGKV